MLDALRQPDDARLKQEIHGQVRELCQQFPVPAVAMLTV
jgi:hypothetical protein